MAGHNKWSKIKRQKGVNDAKRSKIWTKVIREITVATRMGGQDANSNPRLRKALDDAKTSNMPKDTIARAISKGSAVQSGADYEELTYEGYGPYGVAVVVECLTDNRNRTSSEVKSIFNKLGGNLGSSGSVLFMFDKKGQIVLDKKPESGVDPSEELLLDIGLDAGLEEIIDDDDCFVVECDADNFHNLTEVLRKNNLHISSSEVALVPQNTVDLAGEKASKMMRIIDNLEDLDDVQKVWHNGIISEKDLQNLI